MSRRALNSPVIYLVLLFLSEKTLFAQGAAEDDFALHSFGIQLSAGVMPKPEIRIIEDYYKMHAGVQPSFDAEFYYTTNTGEFWTYSLGVGVTLISSHYYLHIPDDDLSGFPSTQGAPQIENKQVYFQLKIPFRLAYKFRPVSNGYWNAERRF